jgi:hypothetical protein
MVVEALAEATSSAESTEQMEVENQVASTEVMSAVSHLTEATIAERRMLTTRRMQR